MRFADTSYFLALLNASDEWHGQAVRRSEEGKGLLVTTFWVLTEVGDALCESRNRAVFTRLMDSLMTREDVMLLPSDENEFHQGMELFRSRPDKDWSLTDCISFAVMTELAIKEALTSDRHFIQAGFHALLRDES